VNDNKGWKVEGRTRIEHPPGGGLCVWLPFRREEEDPLCRCGVGLFDSGVLHHVGPSSASHSLTN
jgi:hypothetical protein